MSRFKNYISETVGGKLPKGWTKDSVVKFGKTIGIGPGEHGFFDACVKEMSPEMGEEDAKGMCANMKDVFYNSVYWRGKDKSKSEIEKDTEKKKNVG